MQTAIQVVGAVIIRARRVLLLRKRDRGIWFFCGGKINNGEGHIACLAREAEEELGIKILSQSGIGTFAGEGLPGQEVEVSCYLVTDFVGEPQLSTEHDGYAWVAASELGKYNITKPTLACIEQLIGEGYL